MSEAERELRSFRLFVIQEIASTRTYTPAEFEIIRKIRDELTKRIIKSILNQKEK